MSVAVHFPFHFPKTPREQLELPRDPECVRSPGREARAQESPEKRCPGGQFLFLVPKLEIALCGGLMGHVRAHADAHTHTRSFEVIALILK